MDPKIVVIGASLGGLHAVRAVLRQLPAAFPAPVAIVQHRDTNSEDSLALYLQKYSAMKVAEAVDKLKITPGNVYVAPTGYHLLVDRGWFSLSTGAPVCASRPSIDVLFESAADIYGKNAIGVLLTGANQDGASGIREIKKRGGMTIVQNPETAECRVMPDSAIAACKVDHVLPLQSIGPFLAGLFK